MYDQMYHLNTLKEKKYKNINKILNNIEITDDIQLINTKFTKCLHMWYNDNAIFCEMYKHFRSINIHILHEIVFWYNIGNSGQLMYVIPHHYGYDEMSCSYKKHHTSYLDMEIYYNTQITKCKNNVMAIPIVIYENGNSTAHSNILIIKRHGDGKLCVEYFEPYGNISKYDITFEISYLMNNLFAYEINNQCDIQIINVAQKCSLQKHILFNCYRDSCGIFCIWYAVKRLLNSEEDAYKTYINMENYLIKQSPIKTIKNIIASFISILDINDKGIINNKKSISKSILDRIL